MVLLILIKAFKNVLLTLLTVNDFDHILAEISLNGHYVKNKRKHLPMLMFLIIHFILFIDQIEVEIGLIRSI